MAGLREIQSRIKSIQDTRKITSAMYMISSTKMQKARKELESTETYFYTLQSTVDRILRHLPEMEHIYIENQGVQRKKVGLLVISGDKGLAGNYNHNVLKMAQEFLDDKEREIQLFIVGELGRQYFAGRHVPIQQNFEYTVQNPSFDRARWITEKLLEPYRKGELDEIQVIYTRMSNNMEAVTETHRLLPLERPDIRNIPADVYQEEFLILPSVKEAVDAIVPNYLAGFVYGAMVESFCSEQSARMTAMNAATQNADELLRELSIMYNRARQAAITQEITEVCSGARAQKNKKKRVRKNRVIGKEMLV